MHLNWMPSSFGIQKIQKVETKKNNLDTKKNYAPELDAVFIWYTQNIEIGDKKKIIQTQKKNNLTQKKSNLDTNKINEKSKIHTKKNT